MFLFSLQRLFTASLRRRCFLLYHGSLSLKRLLDFLSQVTKFVLQLYFLYGLCRLSGFRLPFYNNCFLTSCCLHLSCVSTYSLVYLFHFRCMLQFGCTNSPFGCGTFLHFDRGGSAKWLLLRSRFLNCCLSQLLHPEVPVPVHPSC